jgi:hypothetical protein
MTVYQLIVKTSNCMLRYGLLLIILAHGLIHLLGFVKGYQLAEVAALARPISKGAGLGWLAACVLLLLAFGFELAKKEYWFVFALLGVVVSQGLIFTAWGDAKWGTLANLILLAVALADGAKWQFARRTQAEVQQITTNQPPTHTQVLTRDQLTDLPAPVQRWLTTCGAVGQPLVSTVRLQQRGLMRTQPEQTNWMTVQATQFFWVESPAFLWQAEVTANPMVSLMGRDKFAGGKGSMDIWLWSLVPVVRAKGDKIDQGALQRYLAEIVWFPSAAVSPYISWEAIDNRHAKATLAYQGTTGSGIFTIDEAGSVVSFAADRYLGGGPDAVLEKWLIRIKEHRSFNGVSVPAKSEAVWQLKAGDFIWYQLEITDLHHNAK